MLCSDGVSDYINIDEIENALIMDGELSKKADAIIDKYTLMEREITYH